MEARDSFLVDKGLCFETHQGENEHRKEDEESPVENKRTHFNFLLGLEDQVDVEAGKQGDKSPRKVGLEKH